MRIENPRGGYLFLRGMAPYSAGVAAAPGFEIVHARLLPALPLRAGFQTVERHLAALGRPRQALCGLELRSPRPFTFGGFAEFNAGYVEVLKSWNILLDGVNPVARTNVAPALNPPAEPTLAGFSYIVPAAGAPLTFVVAGAGELPEGSLDAKDVVRRGETSPEAIRDKAHFVVDLMEGRLRELGADWDRVTVTNVYTVHDIHPMLEELILPRLGAAAGQGVTWHYTRPPVESIEYEMDLRGCRHEIVLSGTGR